MTRAASSSPALRCCSCAAPRARSRTIAPSYAAAAAAAAGQRRDLPGRQRLCAAHQRPARRAGRRRAHHRADRAHPGQPSSSSSNTNREGTHRPDPADHRPALLLPARRDVAMGGSNAVRRAAARPASRTRCPARSASPSRRCCPTARCWCAARSSCASTAATSSSACPGIVRPADISADNRVASTRVADARIDYSGRGEIARASRQGWLQRFFTILSPF